MQYFRERKLINPLGINKNKIEKTTKQLKNKISQKNVLRMTVCILYGRGTDFDLKSCTHFQTRACV